MGSTWLGFVYIPQQCCVNSYLQVSFYQGKAHRGESGADFLGRYGLNMAGLCLNTSIILCE